MFKEDGILQFKSIRTKFLAFVLPVVLIGFLVFFGVSYKTASDMLDANAETIGVGIGKQAGLEVRRVFESNKAHLEEMSYDDAFLHGDDAAKIAKMKQVKQNAQVFSVISYLDMTGKGFSVEGEQIERFRSGLFQKSHANTADRDLRAPHIGKHRKSCHGHCGSREGERHRYRSGDRNGQALEFQR